MQLNIKYLRNYKLTMAPLLFRFILHNVFALYALIFRFPPPRGNITGCYSKETLQMEWMCVLPDAAAASAE